MSGTHEGGLKAAAKNLARDPDFYRKNGRIGGQNGHTGGFYGDPKRASEAGTLGGLVSSRQKKNKPPIEVRRARAMFIMSGGRHF